MDRNITGDKGISRAKDEDTVFFLRIQFRRNTSWQGTVQCLNSKEKCVFRSVLELGSLMNEAVVKTSGKGDARNPKLTAWEDKESVS